MNNNDASLKGVHALYDMHVARLDSIKTGAAQKAYTKEEVVAFRRETAHLKARLKAAPAPGN
jgi:hypothetical protein